MSVQNLEPLICVCAPPNPHTQYYEPRFNLRRPYEEIQTHAKPTQLLFPDEWSTCPPERIVAYVRRIEMMRVQILPEGA